MRRFTSRTWLGLLLALALVGAALDGAALAGVFDGAQRAATPVPQSIAGPSRDTAGPRTKSGPARGSVGSRFHGKPHELFLTRAHSAIFDVRKLKSVVIKKERPEHEGPLGVDGEEEAEAEAEAEAHRPD